MSLFDLFKKSSKKEPPQGPEKSDPFGTPEMQKKRSEAAMDFVKLFQERTPLLGGKPHAGTVLAVAARLAGTSLFRSINKKDVTPGVIVLSEEVNEAYPQLLNLFAFYCKKNGFDVLAKPVVTNFPEKDKPLMDVDRVLAEYQDQYHEIMKKHGLDYLDGARAGMIVCSIVFQYHCTRARDIDPFVATGIIAMGVIEGAKTAPPPLHSASSTPRVNSEAQSQKNAEILVSVAKQSIDGSGTRLVLGETDAAVQNALDNGGKFILVHPQVAEVLKQKNFDVFLIYEAALRLEINSKIPRIDFVQANVDELYKAWKSKSLTSAPEYVRLIFWLKEHAKTYSYEQSGNSWVWKGS
jgi:hypothetical protein